MGSPDNHDTTARAQQLNRRRKYIIDPAFQWKYALTVTLTVFLISCLASTVLFGVLHQQARLRAMHPESYQAGVSLTIVCSALVFALLTAGGVGYWWLVITHRISGPLFVIGRWLAELGGGRFPNLRPLRRKDEFKGFYAIFRNTVESLKAKKQAELAAFSEALQEVQSAADEDEDTLRTVLHSLETHLEAWRRDAACALGVRLDETQVEPPKEQRRTEKLVEMRS